jgi:hypothetical protein
MTNETARGAAFPAFTSARQRKHLMARRSEHGATSTHQLYHDQRLIQTFSSRS